MSNSDRGYKVVEIMQYTETVYYDSLTLKSAEKQLEYIKKISEV